MSFDVLGIIAENIAAKEVSVSPRVELSAVLHLIPFRTKSCLLILYQSVYEVAAFIAGDWPLWEVESTFVILRSCQTEGRFIADVKSLTKIFCFVCCRPSSDRKGV
jgi:hypothetical protein